MWRSINTAGVLLTVGLGVLLLWAVFPSEGWSVGQVQLAFTDRPDAAADSLASVSIGNVEEFLEVYDVAIDSVALKDSIAAAAAQRRQALMRIQYPNGDTTLLYDLFQKITSESTSGKTRVLHYGDSQIEGDRISGYVRNELQTLFGGTGPGWVPAVEVIPTLAVKQEDSGNWNRYTRYGKKDTTVRHKDYGALMTFSRFTPNVPDSLIGDSAVSAWFSFAPNRSTYSRNRKFTRAQLYYGNNRRPVQLDVLADEALVFSDSLQPTGALGHVDLPLGGTPERLEFRWQGTDSPDIYGVSLEGGNGLYLDNIAMRGSSGTIFKKVSAEQLAAQYDRLNVKLFILQFGGNYVPYIKNKEEAERYGKWFAAQIRYLKARAPGAAVVLIGPSDMAVKDGDRYVTRPYLEEVRDALQAAAFETGSAFWDMYEVMGGRNSMVAWVEADPKLAGSDHTHFTPKGARRIAELFVRALRLDYDAWQNRSKGSIPKKPTIDSPMKEKKVGQ